MAGPPIRGRTTKSLKRDVEALGRLSTSIRLDARLPLHKRERACAKIAELSDLLAELSDLVGDGEAESGGESGGQAAGGAGE